jgi:hypothetical protein
VFGEATQWVAFLFAARLRIFGKYRSRVS